MCVFCMCSAWDFSVIMCLLMILMPCLPVTSRPTKTKDALREEYAHLWTFVAKHSSPYLQYQNMTKRSISIVVFESDE